ncbi:SLC13 family permease [Collinsella bouchesdurhonensis]|uniref:SLC13 family permease n=1 Tax=Collinsella bouchesdurhonensis TaxID=1907654 RepID=UPI003F8ABAA4
MAAAKNKFLTKRYIGFFLAIVVFLLIKFVLPLDSFGSVALSEGGKNCLALSLGAVVMWACGVAQPGYTGILYCALLVLMQVVPDADGVPSMAATVAVAFGAWTKGTMWIVVGAYLIAGAVKDSGLGQRIAYAFMLKFVKSAKSLILSIFALTFVLALLIPHPFPRAFLILAVVSVIAESAGYGEDDRGKLGFLIFAAAVPCSMFFMTGDSTLNPLVASYGANGGAAIGFVDWFIYMSLPMVVATLCTIVLALALFKPSKELVYDREEVLAKQAALGKLSEKEIRTIVWLVIAIALWLTVSGDYLAWVTLVIGVLMAMPVIGEVLTPASWSSVDIKTLMFLTAAMAIGSVGGATGMNAWIADVVLPSTVPANPYLFALLVCALTMIIHMFMGSVMAGLGICVPAFLTFIQGTSVTPIAVALIVFTAINLHYILPFHNLAILVGEGKDAGGYTSKEAMKMGIPMTVVTFLVVLVEAFWFSTLGLM